jgi:hypothetical protein
MSAGRGLSSDASICAARKILLSFSDALFSAWIEEERPMMKGTKVEGKITRSRKGINGTFFMISVLSLVGMFFTPMNVDGSRPRSCHSLPFSRLSSGDVVLCLYIFLIIYESKWGLNSWEELLFNYSVFQ